MGKEGKRKAASQIPQCITNLISFVRVFHVGVTVRNPAALPVDDCT